MRELGARQEDADEQAQKGGRIDEVPFLDETEMDLGCRDARPPRALALARPVSAASCPEAALCLVRSVVGMATPRIALSEERDDGVAQRGDAHRAT